MNTTSKQLLPSLLVLGFCSTLANAATITLNPSAPTPDTDWIYSSAFGSPFSGSTDFSDNNPPPGQSFTTLGSSPSFSLSSITVKGAGSNGEFDNNTYRFHIDIGSISGSSFTSLRSEVGTISKTILTNNNTGYLTFDLDTPLSLAASSEFAFRIYVVKPAEDNSYFGFAKSTAGTYSGGGALNSNGSTLSYQAAGTDFTFYANITAVPEPSTWLSMVFGGMCLLGLRRRSSR